MKILFVVPYVPSLVRVRPYQFIRHLSKRGHQITLLTIGDPQADHEAIQRLEPVCQEIHVFPLPRFRSILNCLAALPGTTPLQAVYAWNNNLAQKMIHLLETGEFDAVHVEHLRGVQYALKAKQHANTNSFAPPIVWDSVDSISHLFRQASKQHPKPAVRMMMKFELSRTEAYEAQMAYQFQRTLVTSDRDRQAFLDLAGPAWENPPISIIPNGVDLEYFRPDPAVEREPRTLVISGKMSYHANINMVLGLVKEVMPLVWAEMPNVNVWIVGQDPGAEIRGLSTDPRITVTGTVPDLRSYLQRAALSVAPLNYGAGIQNKVLEAMACGTPVVSTPLAVSALQTRSGHDLLVAATPENFARSVLDLMANPALQISIGEAGRKYVEQHHSWENTAAHLEGVYFEEITKKSGTYSDKYYPNKTYNHIETIRPI